MFDRTRKINSRSWKARRDPRPVWASHYRGEFSDRAWYTRPKVLRTRTRSNKPDRSDCGFITLNYGSWRAPEPTWPALRW